MGSIDSVWTALDPEPGHARGSRAFVRAAAGDDDLPVPSPTYLLQNVYDELDGVVHSHGALVACANAPGKIAELVGSGFLQE